jgi:hypothetical protein
MACSNLTAGFVLDCNSGFAGVEKLYIANGPVESFSHTSGVVSSITVGGSALVPADFFVFELPRQSSSYTETYNVDQVNGTAVFNQDLSVAFNKLSAEKRNQIALIAQATSMVVVFKTNEGKWFSVGLENGAFLSAGSTVSGTNYTDRAGYELTISGIEAAPSFEVDGAIVEA